MLKFILEQWYLISFMKIILGHVWIEGWRRESRVELTRNKLLWTKFTLLYSTLLYSSCFPLNPNGSLVWLVLIYWVICWIFIFIWLARLRVFKLLGDFIVTLSCNSIFNKLDSIMLCFKFYILFLYYNFNIVDHAYFICKIF